ncbi:hypothetical protein ACP3V3_19840 [Vibrio sp. PNB22_3_1]
MTRQEAIDALKEGALITHKHFTETEWVKGHRGKYLFEDGVKCTPDEFWSSRSDEAFDEDWSYKTIIISDKCICGEVTLVEYNAKNSDRSDNKRPHYADSCLPPGLPNLHYSPEDITVFICRSCFHRVSDTVPHACYETDF